MGDRDREKGDRDRLAGAWLAGWTSEAEREASKAVTAVAIEVAVVVCCPTSEQARGDAAEADEAVKRARRGGEVSKQRIGEREAEARVREVSGRSYASGFSDGPSKELATSTVVSSRAGRVVWVVGSIA